MVTNFENRLNAKIREVTKYNTAKELIASKPPTGFIWASFGVIALLFVLLAMKNSDMRALIIMPIFIFLLGYPSVLIIAAFKRSKIKHNVTYVEKADSEELVEFLNENLGFLYPFYQQSRGGI